MRFRLGLNQQGQGAEGFGRGFSNLAQLPIQQILAADQAQQDEAKRQMMASQMGAHAAQARLSDAHAALYDQQRRQAEGVPGQLDLGLAARTGVDLPTINAWRTQMTTGKTPTMTVPGDPTADAPMQDGTVQLPGLDKSVMQRIATEYSQLLPAYTNPDKFKVDDLAQARGLYQKQGAIDAVFANPGQAPAVGQAYAATEGKPLVDNVGNTGRSFNRFTGAGGTIDPGLAALFDQGELAQVAQREAAARNQDAGALAHKASATNSYASAALHRAQTGKVGEEVAQLRTGPKGVLQQTDQGLVSVDPRTNVATPVVGPDGKALTKPLKEIPGAQNTAFIENAKALQNIDAAIEAIKTATGISLDANGKPVRDATVKPNSPDALGVRNYLGDGIRQRTDPNGVTVRAQVANIGGQRFHDVSGAAVTASEAARLRPFIPQATDSPGVALQKLANMRREYQSVNDMLGQTYSREQGYRPSPAARPAGGGVVDFNSLGNPAPGGPAVIDFGRLR